MKKLQLKQKDSVLEELYLNQTPTHKLLIGTKTNLDWSFGLIKDSQSQKWKFDMSSKDQLKNIILILYNII